MADGNYSDYSDEEYVYEERPTGDEYDFDANIESRSVSENEEEFDENLEDFLFEELRRNDEIIKNRDDQDFGEERDVYQRVGNLYEQQLLNQTDKRFLSPLQIFQNKIEMKYKEYSNIFLSNPYRERISELNNLFLSRQDINVLKDLASRVPNISDKNELAFMLAYMIKFKCENNKNKIEYVLKTMVSELKNESSSLKQGKDVIRYIRLFDNILKSKK